MRGIILAGGTGSRLYPLTKVTNKHLLPIGEKPMIYYPIEKLVNAGITEILIVTGTEHMGDVVSLLGSGRDFNCHFTYKVQDEAGGIAQALGLAEIFANNEKIVVILGDNIFEDDINDYVRRFKTINKGALVLLKEVLDPQRFGVAEFLGDKIISIEEKPASPKSKYIVTGIYMYDSKVFDIIKTLNPSKRGELEITDVNNAYLNKQELYFDILKGWWTDAGIHSSYKTANELALQKNY